MKYLVTALLLTLQISLLHSQETTPVHKLISAAVTEGGLVNYKNLDKEVIDKAHVYVSDMDYEAMDRTDRIAGYINAYNVVVIKKIYDRYPTVKSVKAVASFFTEKQRFGSEEYSLNELEDKILQLYGDGSIHFVLNCGAVSCPPLRNLPYSGAALDQEIAESVKDAMRSTKIIGSDGSISEIFRWYDSDFTPSVSEWIESKTDKSHKAGKYLTYDWSLNDSDPIALFSGDGVRYYASNLYTNGAYEVSMFNNYYTQSDPGGQADWFTSTVTGLYGINKQLNIGLDLRIRSTQAGDVSRLSNFGALSFSPESVETDSEGNTTEYRNAGLSALGLRVKYQPIKTIPTLTFQHLLYIPTIGSGRGFLDWESPYLLSDAYFDKDVGTSAAVFFNLGFHIENINAAALRSGDGFYQLSTPFTFIYSYFPTEKSTIYALGNFAPRWGYSVTEGGGNHDAGWSPYGQIGAGYKYFVTDALQVELLYTKFYSNIEEQTAQTFNIGLRYIGW